MEEKITIIIPDRAVGYIRVSTPDQAEDDKVSPEQQRQSIRAYIEKQGWEFVRFYEDLGISGSTMDDRHDLKDLLADAMKEKFDKVVVDKIDRFGRNNADFLNNKNILEAVGVHLVSVKEYFDETYVGHFSAGIMGQVAELEKDRITERVLGGRRENLKLGRGILGKLPYGRYYERVKDGKDMGRRDYKAGIKLDKEKAGIIKKVVKEYLDGGSLSEASLEVGIKYATLLQILKTQCGDKWTITFKANTKFRAMQEPLTEVIPVPRLLDDLTIKRVQQMIDHNRNFDRWKKVDKYPLSGFLKCSHCHRGLTGQSFNGKVYLYYKHQFLTDKQKREKVEPCPAGLKYLNAREVESHVFKIIYEHVKDEALFFEAIKKAFPDNGQQQSLKKDIGREEKRLKKVDKALDKLADAIINGIELGVVKRKQDDLLQEKAIVEGQIRELRGREEFSVEKGVLKRQSKQVRESLLDYFDSKGGLEAMPYEHKKRLFHWLFPPGEKNLDGTPYGIYIKRFHDRVYDVTIHARLFLDNSYLNCSKFIC